MNNLYHERVLEIVEQQETGISPAAELHLILEKFSSVFSDYDKELESKATLEKSLLTLQTLLNTTPEAVFSFKAGGAFEQMNTAAAKFLQLEHVPHNEVTSDMTLPALLSQLKHPDKFLDQLEQIASDNLMPLRGYMETIDGRDYEFYSAAKIAMNKYMGRIWCWRDITEVRKKDAIIEHQAFHDSLTGLPNRRLLLEHLDHAIARAKRSNTLAAVLFIDLDDFKKINDTAGHQQGDEFLIAVSERIKTCVRSSDLFGRSGGDEFLIIAEDINNINEIHSTYQRILKSFQEPLIAGKLSYFVSCSIGVSIYPNDGGNADVLIQRADSAMYEAKRRGKNTYQLFEPKLEFLAQEKHRIETELRTAIKNDTLTLHYQPVINMTNGTTEVVEALIRWPDKQGKHLPPSSFITIAEEAGMIYLLTEWVIKKAFMTIKRWGKSKNINIPIAINLSAIDIQKASLVDYILNLMDEYEISGDKIIFEVQESIFLEDITTVKHVIKTLGEKGIRFAIDDFGTGYSSFKYLQLLAFDFIKIDRSFITNIDSEPQNAAIAKSIIEISTALNATVIAEGIENPQELDYLKSHGCIYAQGFLLSKPLSEKKLLAFLK